MKALKRYVDSKNTWSAIFGSPALTLNSAADRQKIAASLDADLSPENLTCDGELRGSQLRERYNYLTQAAKELQTLDPAVKFYEFG